MYCVALSKGPFEKLPESTISAPSDFLQVKNDYHHTIVSVNFLQV